MHRKCLKRVVDKLCDVCCSKSLVSSVSSSSVPPAASVPKSRAVPATCRQRSLTFKTLSIFAKPLRLLAILDQLLLKVSFAFFQARLATPGRNCRWWRRHRRCLPPSWSRGRPQTDVSPLVREDVRTMLFTRSRML